MSIQIGDPVVVEERGEENPQVMLVEEVGRVSAWCTWSEAGTTTLGDWFDISDLKKVG